MKLNNRGFAISGIIYALMFLFIILIFATLGLLGSRKIVLDKYKQEVIKEIENSDALSNAGKVDRSGASTPILAPSMIPVIYNGTNFVKAQYISEYEQEWYNYGEHKWANAVIIKASARNNYNNIADGQVINQNDILAYYVWIPRYRYKLFNADYNVLNSSPQLIDIIFEGTEEPKSVGTLNNEYFTHPAFTFGNQDISGFWFGKFETTGTIDSISVLPNQSPIVDKNIKTMFDATKNSATSFGLGNSDMHMSKNSEWAAVSYLSHSIYGQGNVEIRKNAFNQSGIRTGCGSNTTSNAPRTAGCEMGFMTSTTYPQSTTGDITGVFDMSGGAWEYLMAVMLDQTGKPQVGSSGFTDTTLPNVKYYDTYSYVSDMNGANTYKSGTLGSATKETWGWYSDRTYFVFDGSSWQFRGGCRNDQDDVGIFAFSNKSGEADGSISFRTTIVVN